MEIVNLEAKKREKIGSRYARNLRRKGYVPAIVYGHGMAPVSLEVDQRKLAKALKTKAGENAVMDLKVDGVELVESTCLIKAIQHHPINDTVEHVDFGIISMREKIEVKVHLIALHQEEAPGVREGGILDIVHHELPIECLPTQIPEHVEVDVKKMKIGDAIHVADINFGEGVECLFPAEEVLVALHPPKKAEEEAPAAEGEEATQPEVIEKGKKDEGEEGEGKPAAESKKKD